MILIIEEEEALRKGAKAALAFAGHRVIAVPTFENALEAVFASSEVLACVVLSGESAPSWAAKIRRGYPELPILVCMPNGRGLSARLEALNSGADDFLPGPASVGELVQRVGGLLKRATENRGHIRVGNVQLEVASRTLLIDGAPLVLAQSRHAVLEALLRRRGAVVPRGDLMDISGAQSAGALEALISRLRRALKDRGGYVRIAAACNSGYYIEAIEANPYEASAGHPTSMVAG